MVTDEVGYWQGHTRILFLPNFYTIQSYKENRQSGTTQGTEETDFVQPQLSVV